jgi:hypothetical protein
MPSSLIQFINNSIAQQQTNELETTNNQQQSLNYQFMYKQLESAVEEILVAYPNDPVVRELKSKLINNLKPILEQIQR